MNDLKDPKKALCRPSRKLLVVVDSTPECLSALHFAVRRARNIGGCVMMLYILTLPHSDRWPTVQTLLTQEERRDAENLLYTLARQAQDTVGIYPEFSIVQGPANKAILDFIRHDPSICGLVLGADARSDRVGPGPLVSLFAGELSGQMPLPVTIIPGSMTLDQIDVLT